MGRHSDYTIEKADEILSLVIDGKSLRRICQAEDMPDRATVFRWLDLHPDFATKYTRARALQADHLEEDMADIEERALSGEIDAPTARAVLGSKQWRASKLAPKKYGDKLELAGDPERPLIATIERVLVRANPPDTDR
jgi:hypothetical protein